MQNSHRSASAVHSRQGQCSQQPLHHRPTCSLPRLPPTQNALPRSWLAWYMPSSTAVSASEAACVGCTLSFAPGACAWQGATAGNGRRLGRTALRTCKAGTHLVSGLAVPARARRLVCTGTAHYLPCGPRRRQRHQQPQCAAAAARQPLPGAARPWRPLAWLWPPGAAEGPSACPEAGLINGASAQGCEQAPKRSLGSCMRTLVCSGVRSRSKGTGVAFLQAACRSTRATTPCCAPAGVTCSPIGDRPSWRSWQLGTQATAWRCDCGRLHAQSAATGPSSERCCMSSC